MESIRESREIVGLSQFALAKRARIPRMRLSLAECGEIQLRSDELSVIRQVLRKEIQQQSATLQTALSAMEETAAGIGA